MPGGGAFEKQIGAGQYGKLSAKAEAIGRRAADQTDRAAADDFDLGYVVECEAETAADPELFHADRLNQADGAFDAEVESRVADTAELGTRADLGDVKAPAEDGKGGREIDDLREVASTDLVEVFARDRIDDERSVLNGIGRAGTRTG
jgi:hypothetical protein